MATKAEKIATIKNMVPPVDLTGEETIAELDAIIKSKNGVEPASETKASKPNIDTGTAKSSVTFTLTGRTGPKTRVFSEEDHGEDFNAVADEFHETNKEHILARKHQ